MDITCSKSDYSSFFLPFFFFFFVFPPLFVLSFNLCEGVTYGAEYLISASITAIYTNTLALCFASTMADMVFAFQMKV
jgi:ABC-type sulfate transport system permease component